MTRDIDADGVIQSGRLKGSRTTPPSVYGGQREIVWHPPTPPTVSASRHGDETHEEHPAYGHVHVGRMSTTPGAVLFDSDIRHREFIRLTVKRATRDRGLKHDWIHESGPELLEVDLSMAQWAALVSSSGSSGVPATIRATETNANVPGLVYEPRLGLSLDEARNAAHEAFGEIQQAMAALDALDAKAPAKDKREAMSTLRAKIANATANVDFAAKSLVEHSENVVTKARADVEAMVTRHAAQLGLSEAQTPSMDALEAGQ